MVFFPMYPAEAIGRGRSIINRNEFTALQSRSLPKTQSA